MSYRESNPPSMHEHAQPVTAAVASPLGFGHWQDMVPPQANSLKVDHDQFTFDLKVRNWEQSASAAVALLLGITMARYMTSHMTTFAAQKHVVQCSSSKNNGLMLTSSTTSGCCVRKGGGGGGQQATYTCCIGITAARPKDAPLKEYYIKINDDDDDEVHLPTQRDEASLVNRHTS